MGDGLTLEKLKIDERMRAVEVHIAARNEMDKITIVTLERLTDKVGIQNGRISKMEQRQAWFMGGISAASCILGALGFIISLLKH